MAPRSSIIAKAVRKTFKDNGTLFPNRESTPKEKFQQLNKVKISLY